MAQVSGLNKILSSWYVWLFPLFAVLICLWLLVDHFQSTGPLIKINFDDGSSLQPQKTRVRFRGVDIGSVTDVKISEDGKNVVAFVRLKNEARHFAVEGSSYWIVSPKVSFQGITGLETLLEGAYIAVQPGKDDAAEKTEFNGRIGGESSDPLEDTVPYQLETSNADSYNIGDSISFRGLRIGSISKITLSKSSQKILLHINVENRYVKVIRTNSVFWRKVAVQAKLGLFNSSLKINSLESVLKGGIDVSTPDDAGAIANAGSKFTLAEGPPKGSEKWNPKLEF